MKTLVLYSCRTDQPSYYSDWADAFNEHANYNANCINVFASDNNLRKDIKKSIEKSDLIVLLHSMNADTLEYLTPFVSSLKNRNGKLVSFVGNEVNLPTISMTAKIKLLQELNTNIIATQLTQEAGEWLYADCRGSKVISLPHALNPKVFYPITDYCNRKIDIGTRSAHYGAYIGDNDRNNIILFFHKNAEKYGISVNLGLDENCQKRFNRQEWAKFLNSCKATLSTEAGSFYLEKDDKLVKTILKYLQSSSNNLMGKFIFSNEIFLQKLYKKILPGPFLKKIFGPLKNKIINSYNIEQEFKFTDIYERFFLNTPKCPAYSKCISSRHFDAIGTKTLHIMYPGRYNDILIPGEHYFELKKDHSNFDELLKIINNPKALQEITNRTYDYVMKKHTYKDRLDTLSHALN